MKSTLITLLLTLSQLAFADFTPTHAETSNYKLWAASDFKPLVGQSLENCAVDIHLSDDQSSVAFTMGIQGSNFEVFGWDVAIPLSDLPLKAGYSKEFVTPGITSMILTYDGKTLSYKYLKRDGLWSRIYPFELVIDGNLSKPVSLNASLSGYEADVFGSPVKHLTTKCKF